MAFWIVYQGNSWDRARKGGYLWAPKVGKKGQTQAYWATMERVMPGDLIFSGVDNALRAVAEATLPAYTAERPDPFSAMYDAAFDALLRSFADDGTLMLASDFPIDEAIAAGINPVAKINISDAKATEYLAEHRALMAARSARNS